LERISPSTPVSRLLEPILEERKNFVQLNRENITYQTFLQRAAGDNFFRAEDFTDDYIDANKIKEDESSSMIPSRSLEDDEKLTPEEIASMNAERENMQRMFNREKEAKKTAKEEMFFKYFEEKNYDFSKDPKELDILPMGFKSRVNQQVKRDLDKVFRTDDMGNIQDDLIKKYLQSKKIPRSIEDEEEEDYYGEDMKMYRDDDMEESDDYESRNQFDENILTAERIRELKQRKSNDPIKEKELMDGILQKFNSLDQENSKGDNEEILEKFETFIKEKNSYGLASKVDELTRKKVQTGNKNYEKFKRVENFKTGFHSYKEENVKLDKEKEKELEELKDKSKIAIKIVKLEKEKMDFLKDLSSNFKEEIETSEKFKDFFQSLKSSKKYMKYDKK